MKHSTLVYTWLLAVTTQARPQGVSGGTPTAPTGAPGGTSVGMPGGFPFALPSGFPPLPSGFQLPSGFPAFPSGFSFPAFPSGFPNLPLLGGQPGAQPGGQINSPEALASPGIGKYAAHFFNDSSLPQHTIYQPKEIPAGMKAPILVWGNGGCLNVGTIMAPFLIQLASQGIVVIANGNPAANSSGSFASFGSYGQSSSKNLVEAIDWAEQNAGKGKWAHLDPTRVAAAGQSCGGGETYGVSHDPRVKVLGIFNSGGMGAVGNNAPSTFTKPIFYFLGGPSDLAYQNGKRDYGNLPATLPAWLGNWAPTGHGGTFNQINGGVYGVAASHWVQWVLRGNTTAGKWFTDGSAEKDGWTEVTNRNIDKFQPPSPLT